MTAPHETTPTRSEDDDATSAEACYELILFVNRASDRSARTIANARRLCDRHLLGRYHLSVVDVHDDPDAVRRSSVLAVPTLLRISPPPMRRAIGDLSHTEKVLLALDLPLANDVQHALG
jgi:circadian clock protein KaiB